MSITSRFYTAAAVALVASVSHAATWVGSSGTDWITAANWQTATAPVTGDSLVFGVAGSGTTLTNTLTSAAFNIGGITYNSGASAYTMGGNAFTLTGNITNNSIAAQVINEAITLSGTTTVTTTTGGGNVSLGGAVSGSGSLIIAGTGVTTLALANSFTGNITVNSGTLAASTGQALGAASNTRTVTVNTGGTLLLNSNNIFGGGGVVLANFPTLAIIGGTVTSNNYNALGNVTLGNGGVLGSTSTGTTGYTGYEFKSGAILTVANTAGTAGSSITSPGVNLGGTVTFNVGSVTGGAGADLTVSGILTNASPDNSSVAGTLVKTGTGTLLLTGANTFSGGLAIQAGTVQVGGTTGSLGGPALTLGSGTTGGTLVLGDASNARTASLSSLNTSGTGTNAIVAGGAAGNGTLTVNGTSGSATFSGTIGGTGSNQNNLALTKTGAGTQTLSGNNTYTGATTVSGGLLNLNGTNVSAVTVNSGGSFGGTGSTTGLVTFNAGSSLALGGAASTAGFTSNGVTFAGATSLLFTNAPQSGTTYNVFNYGSGAITSQSNLTSSYRGTFGGTGSQITFTAGGVSSDVWAGTTGIWDNQTSATWVNAIDNKFAAGDSVTFNEPASPNVVTLTGPLLPASVSVTNTTNTYTFSGTGSITGSAALTKTGAGTLILANTSNTYTGGTTVSAGTLQANLIAALPGAVSVASGATLILNAPGTGSTWSNTITGSGRVVIQTGAGGANNTYVNGISGFTGTIQVSNTGTTGDKWSTPVSATGATVIIDSGSQIYLGSGSVTFSAIQLSGTGNSENRGAIRVGGTLTATTGYTLLGNTTFGMEGGTITGAISGTATSGNTQTLTLGTSNSTGGGIISSAIGNGSGGGTLALTVATGTTALSVQNTYTGNTTINGGILNLTGGGGSSGAIRGTVTVNTGGTLRLSTGDATGYNGGPSSLNTINLIGGTLNVNSTSNQTLGSAVINMTGGSITGIAGSNLDFFGSGSALNTSASATTATITGITLSALRQGNTTFTVAKGTTTSGVDLDIGSVITPSPSGDPAGATLTKAGLGTLRLKAANTGGSSNGGQIIRVSAGTLVTGNTAALGTYAVQLGGGTLQIGDASYVTAGASGTGVQTVNIGSGKNITTVAATASILKFDSTASQIVLSGGGKYDFSAAGSTLAIDLGNAFNTANTYNLIVGGTANVDAASYSFVNVNTGAFSYAFSNGVLTVSAIPEPSAYGLLGAGALAAASFVRRRRKIA